jgi:hypothetical protein
MEWIKVTGILGEVAPGMFSALVAFAGCAGASVDKTLQAEELLDTAGYRSF